MWPACFNHQHLLTWPNIVHFHLFPGIFTFVRHFIKVKVGSQAAACSNLSLKPMSRELTCRMFCVFVGLMTLRRDIHVIQCLFDYTAAYSIPLPLAPTSRLPVLRLWKCATGKCTQHPSESSELLTTSGVEYTRFYSVECWRWLWHKLVVDWLQCMRWLWYVAVDFQLYCMSFIIILLIHRFDTFLTTAASLFEIWYHLVYIRTDIVFCSWTTVIHDTILPHSLSVFCWSSWYWRSEWVSSFLTAHQHN